MRTINELETQLRETQNAEQIMESLEDWTASGDETLAAAAQELVDIFEQHGIVAVAAAINLGLRHPDELRQACEEHYQGAFRTYHDYGYEYLHNTGDLAGMAKDLQRYFDFEEYALDCERGGDISVVEMGPKKYFFSTH